MTTRRAACEECCRDPGSYGDEEQSPKREGRQGQLHSHAVQQYISCCGEMLSLSKQASTPSIFLFSFPESNLYNDAFERVFPHGLAFQVSDLAVTPAPHFACR